MDISLLLTYIVPVASIFLSYMLGSLQASVSSKKETCKTRYEEFYAPFISKLYAGALWERNFDDLAMEAKMNFIDTIFQNLKHLDKDTLNLIPQLYINTVKYINNDYDQALSNQLSASFLAVTQSILKQTSKLCKKLKITDIGEPFAKLYDQSTRKHKTM